MIIIEIQEIIDSIPSLLNYIVTGYVFLSIVGFITCKSLEDYTVKITASIVASYILTSVYKCFYHGDTICTGFLIASVIVSAILGWLTGLLLKSGWFNNVLVALGFGRTTNFIFWRDILEKDAQYEIYMKDSDIMYEGFISRIEEDSDTPYIRLNHYRICKAIENNDLHYEPIYDYNPESTVKNCKPNVVYSLVVNMSDVDHIEFKTDISKPRN